MARVLSLLHEGEGVSPLEASLLEHLQTICTSKTFENSPTLKNLLIYLFQKRNEEVSEYTIAVQALYRRADFDPQIDATVRVQVSRLRRRLKEFYNSEGRSTGQRFSIPLGTHQLVLDQISNGASQPEDPAIAPHRDDRSEAGPQRIRSLGTTGFKVAFVLGCLVVVLAVVCGWQYWKLRSQAFAVPSASSAQLLPLWKEFYADGKPARIVIPNPVFFSWGQPPDEREQSLIVRDTTVNDFLKIEDSAQLAKLRKRLGQPQLAQYYAVSSDVIACLKVMHYLDARDASVNISISSGASAEMLEGENVILVGTPGTLTPFQHQLDLLYFKFEPQGQLIHNAQPFPSEPREFKLIQESPSRTIFPGLIALIPGSSKGSHLMILAGRQTAALVSYLTSDEGNRELQEARNRVGGASFFEAVILSEVDGDTVLNSRLVAFRPFTPRIARN